MKILHLVKLIIPSVPQTRLTLPLTTIATCSCGSLLVSKILSITYNIDNLIFYKGNCTDNMSFGPANNKTIYNKADEYCYYGEKFAVFNWISDSDNISKYLSGRPGFWLGKDSNLNQADGFVLDVDYAVGQENLVKFIHSLGKMVILETSYTG